MLVVLGALAGVAMLMSQLPRTLAWPLAAVAVAAGLRAARREARRQRQQWVWPAEGAPTLDGVEVEAARVLWRGPLAFLAWRDRDHAGGGRGPLHRRSWWPDTLDARERRELRLAAAAAAASRSRAPMAG